MTQHLLIQVSHHCVQATHASYFLQRHRLAQPKRRQAQTTWWDILAARRQTFPDPLFQGLSPGGSHLATRCHTLQGHPYCSIRLAAVRVSPGVISVAHLLLFLTPQPILIDTIHPNILLHILKSMA